MRAVGLDGQRIASSNSELFKRQVCIDRERRLRIDGNDGGRIVELLLNRRTDGKRVGAGIAILGPGVLCGEVGISRNRARVKTALWDIRIGCGNFKGLGFGDGVVEHADYVDNTGLSLDIRHIVILSSGVDASAEVGADLNAGMRRRTKGESRLNREAAALDAVCINGKLSSTLNDDERMARGRGIRNLDLYAASRINSAACRLGNNDFVGLSCRRDQETLIAARARAKVDEFRAGSRRHRADDHRSEVFQGIENASSTINVWVVFDVNTRRIIPCVIIECRCRVVFQRADRRFLVGEISASCGIRRIVLESYVVDRRTAGNCRSVGERRSAPRSRNRLAIRTSDIVRVGAAFNIGKPRKGCKRNRTALACNLLERYVHSVKGSGGRESNIPRRNRSLGAYIDRQGLQGGTVGKIEHPVISADIQAEARQ